MAEPNLPAGTIKMLTNIFGQHCKRNVEIRVNVRIQAQGMIRFNPPLSQTSTLGEVDKDALKRPSESNRAPTCNKAIPVLAPKAWRFHVCGIMAQCRDYVLPDASAAPTGISPPRRLLHSHSKEIDTCRVRPATSNQQPATKNPHKFANRKHFFVNLFFT